jgi:hypothetical protein
MVVLVVLVLWSRPEFEGTSASDGLIRLARDCWAADAKQRPKFEQISSRLLRALLEKHLEDELAREAWAQSFGYRTVCYWMQLVHADAARRSTDHGVVWLRVCRRWHGQSL